MISRDDLVALRDTRWAQYQRRGLALVESHLEAWNEIDRLRSGMEAMLAALDHIDAGRHERALAQIEKLGRLA